MKKILIPFLFFAGIMGFIACQKENSSDLDPLQEALSRIKNADTTITDTCRYGNCYIDSVFMPLTGDQINITPSLIDSGAISGLVFTAKTQNYYPCAVTRLLSTAGMPGGNYTIEYLYAVYSGNCTSGQSQAQSSHILFPIQDGNHVFKVLLNGVTYTGSFTKTGNQYSFNWPYTSGVTISPQNL